MSEEEDLTCQNCKLKIASQNYVMHTLHCTRHIELCSKCREPIPKGNLDEHMKIEHAKEPCTGCGKSFENRLLQIHAESECPKRLITCLYCELELPSNDMIAHTDYCGTRTEKCKDCGEFVMLKYTQLHLDSNHKFLKLEDEPGPSASWEQNKASAFIEKPKSPDIEEVTLLPCEFCDGMFTPRELRRHQISCTNGWSTTTPILRRMSTVQCEVCQKSISSKEYETHRIVCNEVENTPSRSDTTSTNVIPCDVCGKVVPFEDYGMHYTMCSKFYLTTVTNSKERTTQSRKKSVIPCDICNESIALEDYRRHRIFCVQPISDTLLSANRLFPNNDSDLTLECEFCENLFTPDRLATHQARCSSRDQQTVIPCELCGELKSLTEVFEHQMTCRVSDDY